MDVRSYSKYSKGSGKNRWAHVFSELLPVFANGKITLGKVIL